MVAKKNKGLAKYFTEQFKVIQFDGFDFVFDNNGKVIVWKSILQNTLELPRLIVSFVKIVSIDQYNHNTVQILFMSKLFKFI